jgi:drug/metabolite transporter (DMT)-like permease
MMYWPHDGRQAHPVLIGLTTALLAALAFGVASILQAIGARGEPTTDGLDLWLLFRMLRHPAFLLSIALSVTGFLLHLVALRSLPLFAVQPLIASSVAVTAIVQAVMGHEPLSRRGWGLVLTVCVGLALVTTAAVSGSAVHTSTTWRAMLAVAAALIGLAGWLVGGVQGARGSSLLGLLSGLGFAIVAISARAMPSLVISSLIRDPAVISLTIGGGVAFLLYSTALQRGTVITATAAMVVGNTVAPVLVGVIALGDQVRSGWEAAVVVGLLLAGTAVVLLHDPREVHGPGEPATAHEGAPPDRNPVTPRAGIQDRAADPDAPAAS